MQGPELVIGDGHLYQAVARELSDAIGAGTLKVGDRLPSTRKLCARYGVSMATAVQAFRELENRRLIEARPRSGFFVSRLPSRVAEPAISKPPPSARYVVTQSLLQEYLDTLALPSAVLLGAALPQPEWFPSARLARLIATIMRRKPNLVSTYAISEGADALRSPEAWDVSPFDGDILWSGVFGADAA